MAKWDKAKAKCQDLRRLEDEAWEEYLPNVRKKLKSAKKANVGIWFDFLPDGIDSEEMDLVDSAGQKLDFRVGPVYGRNGVLPQPGIWIGYQRRFLTSERQGDILVSPKIWRRLVKEIDARLMMFKSSNYA